MAVKEDSVVRLHRKLFSEKSKISIFLLMYYLPSWGFLSVCLGYLFVYFLIFPERNEGIPGKTDKYI